MKIRQILVCLLLFLLLPSSVRVLRATSTDTVNFRLKYFRLPDSISVLCEYGGFGIHNGSDPRYLGFVDTSLGLSYFFRTTSFHPYGDSLDITRFLCFHDRYTPEVVDATDSAAIALYANLYNHRVSPSGLVFDTASYIRFILELRNATSNDVMQRLDTMTAFLDSYGNLRYQYSSPTWSNRYSIPLLGNQTTTAYLDVALESHFPTGIDFTGYEYAVADSNIPAPDCQWQDQIGVSLSGPPGTALRVLTPQSTLGFEALLTPNPTTGLFKISVPDLAGESVVVRVISNVGLVVYEKEIKLAPKDPVQLDLSKVARGIYHVSVISSGNGTWNGSVVIQ